MTFTLNAAGDFVITTDTKSASSLKGRLKYAGKPISLDEMDAAVASGATESA